MAPRLELQALLEVILESRNVYFQPPPDFQMQYPCIVYERTRLETEFADNVPYSHKVGYQITVIDPNPDSDIYKKVAQLPMCRYDRNFKANKLNHDVLNLFF
jgi:hypothetical protein